MTPLQPLPCFGEKNSMAFAKISYAHCLLNYLHTKINQVVFMCACIMQPFMWALTEYFLHSSHCFYSGMYAYILLNGFRAHHGFWELYDVTGGMRWDHTPQTVTTTKAPAVLKSNRWCWCLPVLCNLSCEHSVRRAIIIRGDTLHTRFLSQGKLWQFAQKENMLLSHDVCIKHRLSVWFRESVKRVIKEIKKDNSALSLPYLLRQLHCGI